MFQYAKSRKFDYFYDMNNEKIAVGFFTVCRYAQRYDDTTDNT